jgi:hypothetical protein
MHDHAWHFTDAPGRWAASCACGLAVEVTMPAPGRSTWEWTLHGEIPPADAMLEGLRSVLVARREERAAGQPGPN